MLRGILFRKNSKRYNLQYFSFVALTCVQRNINLSLCLGTPPIKELAALHAKVCPNFRDRLS